MEQERGKGGEGEQERGRGEEGEQETGRGGRGRDSAILTSLPDCYLQHCFQPGENVIYNSLVCLVKDLMNLVDFSTTLSGYYADQRVCRFW